jgi:hypothetical protein
MGVTDWCGKFDELRILADHPKLRLRHIVACDDVPQSVAAGRFDNSRQPEHN